MKFFATLTYFCSRICSVIQKGSRPSSNQNWQTFLQNHPKEGWSYDFIMVNDALFGQLYAFFILQHCSWRIIHFGVTRHPKEEWVPLRLREAIPFVERPKYLKYLIRDNDAKFGKAFDELAESSAIKVLKLPLRHQRQTAFVRDFSEVYGRNVSILFNLERRPLNASYKRVCEVLQHSAAPPGNQAKIPSSSSTISSR